MNKKSLFLAGASIFSAIVLFALVSTPAQAQTNCVSGPYTINAQNNYSRATAIPVSPPGGCVGPIIDFSEAGTCSWTWKRFSVSEFGLRKGRITWANSTWNPTTKRAGIYFDDEDEGDNKSSNNYGSCRVKLTWSPTQTTPPTPPVPPTPDQSKSYLLEVWANYPAAPYKIGDEIEFRAKALVYDPVAQMYKDFPVGFATWNWDFGDGSPVEPQSSTPSPAIKKHTFSKAGNYQVKVSAYSNTSNNPPLKYPGISGQTTLAVTDGSTEPPTTPDPNSDYELQLSLQPNKNSYAPGENIMVIASAIDKKTGGVVQATGDRGWEFSFGAGGLNWNVVETSNNLKPVSKYQSTSYDKKGSYTISVDLDGSKTTPALGKLESSVQINIADSCKLPGGVVVEPEKVFSAIDNYQKVKIAAKDLKSWVQKNEAAFRTEVISNQVCYAESNSKPQAKDIINYLNTNVGVQKNKNAVPLVLHELGDEVEHLVIALGFKKVGTTYRLDYLDPNGPKIVKNKVCRTKFLSSGVYLVCSISSGKDTQILIPSNPKDFGVLQLIANQVRNDTAGYILKGNYPSIGNFYAPSGGGVCSGWVHTTLKLVYLADFVGECKPTSALPISNQLAAPGFLSLLQLILFPFNIQPSN